MKKYGIIFWIKGKGPYTFSEPLDPTFIEIPDENHELWQEKLVVFNNLKDADKQAFELEKLHKDMECRVISLDSVHE